MEHLLYTVLSGEFEMLNSTNLITLVLYRMDEALINHLQIKLDKLIVC